MGIAEAGIQAASMVGRSFSIVTTLARTIGQAEHLVCRHGYSEMCHSIYACEVPMLELDQPQSEARKLVTELCRRAVEADQAGLGAAGLSRAGRLLRPGQPRGRGAGVNGVMAAVTFVDALLQLGLRTSTRSEYASPIPRQLRLGLSP